MEGWRLQNRAAPSAMVSGGGAREPITQKSTPLRSIRVIHESLGTPDGAVCRLGSTSNQKGLTLPRGQSPEVINCCLTS